MKKYKDLLELVNNLNQAIVNQQVKGEDTKVSQKLGKLAKKLEKHLNDYNEQVEEIRIDNASTDDKGVILKDEKGGYKFSKDGLKKLLNQIKVLGEKQFNYEAIHVVNPAGLEEFSFLSEWLTNVEFIKEEEL
jgi:transcriptional regulator of heat shock response